MSNPINPEGSAYTKEASLCRQAGFDITQFGTFCNGLPEAAILCRAIVDNEGKLADFVPVEFNDYFLKIIKQKRENILGKKITQIIPTANHTMAFKLFEQATVDGKPVSVEVHFERLGRYYQVSAFKPAQGYFVSIFIDVTKQRLNEEKKKRQWEKTQANIERQRMVQSGINRVLVEALSEGTEAELGLKCLMVSQEITGSDFGFIAEFDDSGLVILAFRNTGTEPSIKRLHSIELEMPKSFQIKGVYERGLSNSAGFFINDSYQLTEKTLPDGHPPLRNLLVAPLIHEGRNKGIIAVGNTKTGYTKKELESLQTLALAVIESLLRKRAEQKLANYSRRLEEIVELRTRQLQDKERLAAIGQTAGMVGHDIRNPLQAIVSSAYLAKIDLENLPSSPEKESILQELQHIEEESTYIDKIVKDLQDYAKPLKPELIEIDFELGARASLALVPFPNNISSALEVQADLPKLWLDPLFFKRVMVNLITNAIQAMPDGGCLTIKAYKNENKAFIHVEDTGKGIPTEIKQKIFTPLFTTKPKGQGFGLAVVKRLIEAQNGHITFESQEGKGTIFLIKFPLSKTA